MKIGEVSKITGLSEHTLRFYEKAGLLPDVAKKRGGIRDYCDRDIGTLGIIECLKKTGMPLTDIKKYMDWCALGDKTLKQRYDMFIERKNAAQRQLTEIQKTLKIIDYKINYYARAVKAGTLAIYDGKKLKRPDFFD